MNFTVLVPWVAPKFVPVIVTDVPTAPDVGTRLVIDGGIADTTVKLTPLLKIPLKVSMTMFPVVAPDGTVTVKLFCQLLVTVAGNPLKKTVPAMFRKSVPVTLIEAPTWPELGVTLVMTGAGNQIPLLAIPPTVTTTLPSPAPEGRVVTIDVLLQLVTDAVTPLNLTVLVPWVEPKLLPVTVTEVPVAPVTGERLVITGAELLTVKFTPLLVWPPTVTSTFPVLAPFGTLN